MSAVDKFVVCPCPLEMFIRPYVESTMARELIIDEAAAVPLIVNDQRSLAVLLARFPFADIDHLGIQVSADARPGH